MEIFFYILQLCSVPALNYAKISWQALHSKPIRMTGIVAHKHSLLNEVTESTLLFSIKDKKAMTKIVL